MSWNSTIEPIHPPVIERGSVKPSSVCKTGCQLLYSPVIACLYWVKESAENAPG